MKKLLLSLISLVGLVGEVQSLDVDSILHSNDTFGRYDYLAQGRKLPEISRCIQYPWIADVIERNPYGYFKNEMSEKVDAALHDEATRNLALKEFYGDRRGFGYGEIVEKLERFCRAFSKDSRTHLGVLISDQCDSLHSNPHAAIEAFKDPSNGSYSSLYYIAPIMVYLGFEIFFPKQEWPEDFFSKEELEDLEAA